MPRVIGGVPISRRVRRVGRLAEIMNADDVGVIQPGQCFGFPREAFGETRIIRGVRLNDLQGDQPIKALLPSFVNGSHSAITKQVENLELRKSIGQFVRFGRNETHGIPGLGQRRVLRREFGQAQAGTQQAIRAQARR